MTYGTVSTMNTSVRESPLLWLPGVDAPLSLQVDATGTVASPTMELYENGNDVSGTKLTGSLTVSGKVIKCKSFASLIGGNQYKYYVRFTDDGVPKVIEGTIICPKNGVNPSRYQGALNWWRAIDAPITIYPSTTITDQMQIDGEGTLASPTMSLYRGTSDVSTDYLSGSMSVTSRTITLKQIASLTAGDYIAYVYFTDGGIATARYFEIIVPKLGAL